MSTSGIDIEVIKSPRRISRMFSETEFEIMKSGSMVTKCFSTDEYAPGLPKTSKVGLKYTSLKVKEFSSLSTADILVADNEEDVQQREYSVATLKERLRYNKLSPRQSFRRLMIDYKQLVKAQGGPGKLDPEDEKVLKSLFTSDVLNILKQIHPEILKGKQISTLLGASSLGKSTRVAAQKLQIPYKMASKEVEKNGAITPNRFKKLSEAYTEFISSMIEEVFGKADTTLPEKELKVEELENLTEE